MDEKSTKEITEEYDGLLILNTVTDEWEPYDDETESVTL